MVVVIFLGLMLVIVAASYLLSRGGEILACKWGCNIVGSIVLALVTTLPEYSFVYWASVKHQYGMAVGSAIGACTILITLGYGLVIVFATSRLSRNPVKEIKLGHATRVDAFYLLVTAIVAFAFVWFDGELSPIEGLILTAIFIGYIVQVFKSEPSVLECETVTSKDIRRAIIEIVIGGIVVYFCSEPFVDSMIELATLVHVSPMVIAVILGPIASEMPEKLTAYMVVLKNGANAELAVCNFLGSKVNHNSLLLAVIPFVAFFHGQTGGVHGLKTPTMLVMTVLTVVVAALLARGRLQRWQGYALIGSYAVAMVIAALTTSAIPHS